MPCSSILRTTSSLKPGLYLVTFISSIQIKCDNYADIGGLMARSETTALFGNEREDNFSAILGNLYKPCLVNPPIPR